MVWREEMELWSHMWATRLARSANRPIASPHSTDPAHIVIIVRENLLIASVLTFVFTPGSNRTSFIRPQCRQPVCPSQTPSPRPGT